MSMHQLTTYIQIATAILLVVAWVCITWAWINLRRAERLRAETQRLREEMRV